MSSANSLADWKGQVVRIKGLIAGHPEVLAEAELVEVSGIGPVLSWKGRRTFFPWTTVVSMRLLEEGEKRAAA
jgi:hypothetical protein